MSASCHPEPAPEEPALRAKPEWDQNLRDPSCHPEPAPEGAGAKDQDLRSRLPAVALAKVGPEEGDFPAVRPLLVIALGNALLRDEGVGMHVLEALQSQADRHPNADFLDLGVAGLALLHHLPGRSKVILIDCAYMNENPGTLRRFTPNDVVSMKTLAGFSLHEGDLLQILELARKLNLAPEEIVIFGIEPEEVSHGEGLSETLGGRLGEYAAAVEAELG